MKHTRRQILKGLQCCSGDGARDNCGQCPYDCRSSNCIDLVMQDAIDLIERLTKDLDRWKAKAEEARADLQQSTADVEEVRHGEWEQVVDPYFSKTIPTISRCSVCGKKYNLANLGYNYCPECGAKMDGGSEQ